MGKVWTRDDPQAAHQQTYRKPTAAQQRPFLKRSANVWTRAGQAQEEKACSSTWSARAQAAFAPTRTDSGTDEPEGPEVKKRRLAAKGRQKLGQAPPQPGSAGAQREPEPNEEHQRQNGANGLHKGAGQAAKKTAQQNALQEEAAALHRRIAEEEAKLAAAKAAALKREAEQAAAQRAKREEQELRKSRLDAGFAEAFKVTRELAASKEAPKVSAAGAAEVERVLAAKSDHEVMQLKPGTERAVVKKRYRAMTLALHPDKCKVEAASDAFQRLVHAYQGVLKFAR